MKDEITIVIPESASNNVELDLVNLTEYLVKNGHDDGSGGGYGLGGKYGYGVDFENDTFMMHPQCWCEQDNCKWCNPDENDNYAPNFHYKPSDFKIEWYKWVGRSMEYNRKLKKGEWGKIYKEVIKSIK